MNDNNPDNTDYPCGPEMNDYIANFSTQRELDNTYSPPNFQHGFHSERQFPVTPSYQQYPSSNFIPTLANQSYYNAILASATSAASTSKSTSTTSNKSMSARNSNNSCYPNCTVQLDMDEDDSSSGSQGDSVGAPDTCNGDREEPPLQEPSTETTPTPTETTLTLEDEIRLCVVSDVEWMGCTQESLKLLDRGVKPSMKKNFPALWDLATRLQLQWESWGWYKAIRPNKSKGIKGANVGDLKKQIVKWILRKREEKKRSADIPSRYFENPASVFAENKEFRFLCKTTFLNHAHNTYRVDSKALEDQEKAVPSDIIRIFGIACSNESRDDICKLTEAKAYTRSDLDGPLHFLDSIFCRWAEKFNDPDFKLAEPDRAKYIGSYSDLNPNSEKRINISRDYKWIKAVYKKVMKDYNEAMRKWKMETGGGSGAPENFSGNWQDRENLELFSHYADKGSCDHLAYILMYDKDVGYTLNAVNDPAPEHTVMENGVPGGDAGGNKDGRKETKAEKRIAKQGKEIASMFGTVMKESIAPLVQRLTAGTTATSTSPHSDEHPNSTDEHSNTYLMINGISQTLNVIKTLEEQVKVMKETLETMSDEPVEIVNKKKRRLEILNKMVDDSFEKLEKFQG